jgi:hypothetical protein
MAITISTTTINDIDATYPVAGVDNDSQGFRDNFTSIKNSLSAAAADLASLDANTAKKNEDNDFNGNKIQEADFIATTETVYETGNITSPQNISFTNGHYQKVEVGGNITLTLADWPASGKLAKLRLEIVTDGSGNYTITWAPGAGRTLKTADGFSVVTSDSATVTVGAWPSPFNVSSGTNPVIVDFWSHDGQIVYAQTQGTFS